MTTDVINDSAAKPDDRVAALRNLIDGGHQLPGFVEESNNHIHTCYSFSPYTPSMAALKGREVGLQVVGSVDHDSISAAAEMRDAAAICGMGAVTGFEIRAFFHSADDVALGHAPFADRKLNNPDSPGVAYLTVQGIPAWGRVRAEEFLAPIRAARLERTRAMTEAANQILADLGVPQLDFEQDVVGISQFAAGGTITERHLLFAMAKSLIDGVGRGKQLLEGLGGMGITIADPLVDVLGDETNRLLSYDLLGLLKAEYLSTFYIQPTRIVDGGELPDAADVVALAHEIGGIACYAYLGDISASPTGDKKAEKFEDEFLPELVDALTGLGFSAITYMPPRNTPEQLARIGDLASDAGLIEVSGVDINQPRQVFSCPQLQRAGYGHLNATTWALVVHEELSHLDPALGLLHPENPLAHLPLPERVAHYGALGPRLVAGASPESVAGDLRLVKE